MTIFRVRCGTAAVEIHEVDHGPPHCHVVGLPRKDNVRVSLLTLEVTKPQGFALPAAVRRCLKQNQLEMLEAWERVTSYPEREE
jgi:hypothetical protein